MIDCILSSSDCDCDVGCSGDLNGSFGCVSAGGIVAAVASRSIPV